MAMKKLCTGSGISRRTSEVSECWLEGKGGEVYFR